MSKIENNVEELVKPIIEKIGYKLYDVIYEKEGKDYFLRIFIDNEKGISLEDCEKVNNAITEVLDEKDYIKDQYFLELSSPGVIRILRKDWQIKENIGKSVEVKLFKPLNGEKTISGELKNFDEENIIINDVNIPRKDISLIKIKFEW